MALQMTQVSREWIERYWESRRREVRDGAAYRRLMADWLDRDAVVADQACFEVAHAMLVQAVILLIVDEDVLASDVLKGAEEYIELAEVGDDPGLYVLAGEEPLAPAARARDRALVRGLRRGQLELAGLRLSCEVKEQWVGRLPPPIDWEESGIDLHEWMAEQIIVGRADRARELAERHCGLTLPAVMARAASSLIPEHVFYLVAQSIVTGDERVRQAACAAMDAYYVTFTAWSPDFRENEVPYDQKLLFAYVRGRFFRGIEDPIRLVKMLKFGD